MSRKCTIFIELAIMTLQ